MAAAEPVHMMKEVSKGMVTAKCGATFPHKGSADRRTSWWRDVTCEDGCRYVPKDPT